MRLYLSSQRLGTAPGALVALLQGKTRIGVIANAVDDAERSTREARLERECTELEALGLEPAEIDLRHHFEHGDGLPSVFESFDALWTLGGNVLALRTALQVSGADTAIALRLRDDSIVYAGYSAGACVLGPPEALSVATFDGSLPGYPQELVSAGLGLLPYAIVPHYDPEANGARVTGLAAHYIDMHVRYVALRDGQAIVVDGDDTRVVE